jgi:hypothetical protein
MSQSHRSVRAKAEEPRLPAHTSRTQQAGSAGAAQRIQSPPTRPIILHAIPRATHDETLTPFLLSARRHRLHPHHQRSSVRMSSTADPPASKAPTTTRLKLTMPSPTTHHANLEDLATLHTFGQDARRPSYSPVTPTFPAGTSDADMQKRHQPEFMDEPDPIPINLDENSDAIALKAALSILQMQKQRSQLAIKQLDRMKAAANKEPEAFIAALQSGKLSNAPQQALVDIDVDDEGSDDEERPDNKVTQSAKPGHDFGQFPNPQNVIRCPPINWSKYHIVGESLDKLHDEQRQRPEPGYARRDEYGRPPEHVIAAPYQPFVDKLEATPGSVRREGKE